MYRRTLGVSCAVILIGGASSAIALPSATIAVQCSGKSGAQVALRWGSPNYNSDPSSYMPLTTVHCAASGTTMPSTVIPVIVRNPDSEIEVQTEGGIETSYDVTFTIASRKSSRVNSITVHHVGSPSLTSTGRGFTLTRTSGPNKYGEQNFRVQLQSAQSTSAHIVTSASGDRGDAQVALRWGHPNYQDNGYLGVLKIKPGAARKADISQLAANSQFEIQTEGGTGTGYDVAIRLGVDSSPQGRPSIEIVYNKPRTDVSTIFTDVGFSRTKGNIYGEMNIAVHAPWIVPAPSPKP